MNGHASVEGRIKGLSLGFVSPPTNGYLVHFEFPTRLLPFSFTHLKPEAELGRCLARRMRPAVRKRGKGENDLGDCPIDGTPRGLGVLGLDQVELGALGLEQIRRRSDFHTFVTGIT